MNEHDMGPFRPNLVVQVVLFHESLEDAAAVLAAIEPKRMGRELLSDEARRVCWQPWCTGSS